MTINLHHGTNEHHEFWESQDRNFLLFRNHAESQWNLTEYYAHKGFADTPEEGCRLLSNFYHKLTLATDYEWRKQGTGYALKPTKVEKKGTHAGTKRRTTRSGA